MARYSLFVLKVPLNTNQPTLCFSKVCVAEAVMFTLCPVVPMSVQLSQCSMPTSVFILLRINTERISVKFAGESLPRTVELILLWAKLYQSFFISFSYGAANAAFVCQRWGWAALYAVQLGHLHHRVLKRWEPPMIVGDGWRQLHSVIEGV